jgi:3D (Asp-Asp-Asp) domain-containing protein
LLAALSAVTLLAPAADARQGCNTKRCERRVELRRTGCIAAACYQRVKPCRARGLFSATSYGPPWGGIQGRGVTAAGVNLREAPRIMGVAADPGVFRLGSRLRVWPNPFGHRGWFRVFDTGGAIRGRRLDFYDYRGRVHQKSWGRRLVRVCT